MSNCSECGTNNLILDPIDLDNIYCSKCGHTDDRNSTDDLGRFCYPEFQNIEERS